MRRAGRATQEPTSLFPHLVQLFLLFRGQLLAHLRKTFVHDGLHLRAFLLEMPLHPLVNPSDDLFKYLFLFLGQIQFLCESLQKKGFPGPRVLPESVKALFMDKPITKRSGHDPKNKDEYQTYIQFPFFHD